LKKNDHTKRSIQLAGKQLDYNCRVSKKAKYLQLRITHDNQLELVVPGGYSLFEAERFLLKKSDWIAKHSFLFKKQNDFYYLGEKTAIVFFYDLFLKKYKVKFVNRVLTVKGPEQSDEILRYVFEVFLKHSAKKYLTVRVNELALKYGFEVKKFSLRGQKTRWGSCSHSGKISLNYRLMKLKKEIIDYIIIHELCHLRQMNHSKKFWLEVEKIIPGYKALKKELRQFGVS
jgi:hypothetical protein